MPSGRNPPRRPRAPSFMTMTSTPIVPSGSLRTLKVCGLVSSSDAALCARIARDYLPPNVALLLGSIIWPHSRRSVQSAEAKKIAAAAHENGAIPVAVFVDETAEEMKRFCQEHGFSAAQLHGYRSRESARNDDSSDDMQWIDVRDVLMDGKVVDEKKVDKAKWRLYDMKGGGTGVAFDWGGFEKPDGEWMLAGGLDEHNVEDAVKTLMPTGLDVATGVAAEDKCKKDEGKMKRFMERVVKAYRL